MTAAIWCKEHVPTKSIVHRMHDIVDEESGLNALQLYVQNFKQADLALTGTVRKATLVSQSAKVVNPTSVAPPPNRRTSTTTNNGSGSAGRGSVSHVKPDDLPGEASSSTQSDSQRICVTCDVNITPKWWPFPPTPLDEPTATSVDASSLDKDQFHSNGHLLTNGHVTIEPGEESSGGHIALAAAALHQNPARSISVQTEFQCHKCHIKKKRKEPSPPPPVSVPRESSRPPIPTPLPTAAVLPREVDIIPPPQHHSPYAWANPPAPPLPPTYATNGPSNNPNGPPNGPPNGQSNGPSNGPPTGPPNGPPYGWSRPSSAQSMPLVNQLNGNHSPRANPIIVQGLSGQPQMRHPSHGLPHSPRQNGHHPQIPNGYPPSPRHSLGSPALHMQSMQNSSYASYAATRPPPQHLTNGGPPPRAPEHPFPQNSAPMHSRGSFGPPQSNPPILRDGHVQGRDLNNPQSSNARPNDGRVNGGASASPSLRNLLS